MINFAGPRVGIEMTLDGISISGLGETNPFVDNYASAVTTNILVVNATDLAPIVPPSSLALGVASVSYQQVSGTTLTFCVQTGSIGGNHSLADTYQPYAQQLADGLQPRRAAAPRSRAARPRQRVLEWARGLLWASFAQTNSASVERIGP
jgi:hypothetical protein